MSIRRILHVSEPGKDGVIHCVIDLIKHLRKRHPDVMIDLAYSSLRGSPELQTLVEDIQRHDGDSVDLRIGNAPQPGDLSALLKLIRLVWKNRPQVVHAHSSKAGALCRLLRALCPGFPPVVYSPNAYYGMGKKTNLRISLFNFLERLFGGIGFTINCSWDERSFALTTLGLSPRRLVLIDNGIDLKRFHPASPAEKKKARQNLGIPEQALVLLSVGRISEQKNYPPLYQAMQPLLSQKRCFFVHAGAGAQELSATFSPAAKKQYLAFVFIKQVELLHHAADAFILTSRYEGLSLSVLQALACGLKVFLTRVPGNACLKKIGFSEISWIEPSEDENELAVRIELSLAQWLQSTHPVSAWQTSQSRKSLDQSVQLEKIWRLYRYLAGG